MIKAKTFLNMMNFVIETYSLKYQVNRQMIPAKVEFQDRNILYILTCIFPSHHLRIAFHRHNIGTDRRKREKWFSDEIDKLYAWSAVKASWIASEHTREAFFTAKAHMRIHKC